MELTPNMPVTTAPVDEPWSIPSSRLRNLNGSKGGKNYAHVGGINTSFEGHLFGAVDPHGSLRQRHILHEKPVHRLMQLMFSKGYTIEEIAHQTGYTRLRVGDVLRQPWAQMNIVEDIKTSIHDEIKQLLEGEVLPSIMVQKQIRDDRENPAAVRLAAAESIINRFLGRPNQPITTNTTEPSKLTNSELESRVSQIVAGVEASAVDPSQP
jgi:hypothetical protein